ncbi:hypothetical protein [Streptomyces sp. NPDC059278]|uniref:hypothetical protein n=1 Tax=Streptomyces sp. NPDC059278 TaxID=3346801 RepID=UPI0036CA89D8
MLKLAQPSILPTLPVLQSRETGMGNGSCPYVIDLTGGDIHAEAAVLRDRGPATRVEFPGDVLAWSITDHGLIKKLLTDDRVSRDAYRHWPDWENGEGHLAQTWPLSIWVQDRNMITAYGADHRRLRKLVSRAFTARRAVALRPRIEEITAGLLDRIAASSNGQPFDLRTEFAYPLPIQMQGAAVDGLHDPASCKEQMVPGHERTVQGPGGEERTAAAPRVTTMARRHPIV